MVGHPTIFVQIASYRDRECQWTVKDLFQKAKHPRRIRVGICWQYDKKEDQDCFKTPSPCPEQTNIISVHYKESGGVCWARAQAQTLFQDEDFVLMIDSHMRFVQDWDEKLVEELRLCPSPKSFLSTYPPGYKPPHYLEENPLPIVMRAKPFTESGDIRFEGENLGGARPIRPLRGAFLAGGFIFAPGKFIREVPYDPYMYFDHEEITLAARAFTHGWDVYSPVRTFVYHYYHEPDKGEKRSLHWQDNLDWQKHQIWSRARYQYLLSGKYPEDPAVLNDIQKYDLGTVRSIRDFEEFSGIYFKTRIVTERARLSQFVEDLDRYRSKPAEQPASSIRIGILLPPFSFRDGDGKPLETENMKGKPFILCLLPCYFTAYMKDFSELFYAERKSFNESHIDIILVAPIPAPQISLLRDNYHIPQKIYADKGLSLCSALGLKEQAGCAPITICVNHDHFVTNIFDNTNASNHINDMLRAVKFLDQSS